MAQSATPMTTICSEAARACIGAGTAAPISAPEAAQIAYFLQKRHLFGDLKVEVFDDEGELITSIPGVKRRGLNRVYWPMRLPPPKLPAATNLVQAFEGPRVPEGTYRVVLTKGDETLEGTVELVADPRSIHSPEDRRLQQETALELYDALSDLTYVVETATELRDAARERAMSLPERNRTRRDLEAWADELEALRASLVSTDDAGWLSGDEKLREELGNLYGAVNAYTGRPTGSQMDRKEVLMAELETAQAKFDSLAARAAGFTGELERRDLEPITVPSREEWEARAAAGGGGTTAVALRHPVKPKTFAGAVLHHLSRNLPTVPLVLD
jgi:hypothetical protein